MSRLAGLVVVLTGASRGIGRATARLLAREGCRLVLAARDAETLDQAAAECAELGGQAIAVPTDVTDAAAVERLAAAAVARFGRIDVWHNNAGVLLLGRLDEAPAAEACRVVETDVIGAMNGARVAVRQFRAQGRGILINTASMLGVVAEPYAAAYIASKFAIRALGASLRAELRGEAGIRVCTLLPIAADTPIFRHCANYTGREPRAVPPAVDPYRVAEAALELIQKPQDERIVGAFGRLLWAGQTVTPGLLEPLIALVGPWLQLRPKPAPPTSGNLFEPVRNGWTVRGGWTETRRRSGLVAGLLGAIVVGGLLVRRRAFARDYRLL